MAGRGRGATLPAWMTADADINSSVISSSLDTYNMQDEQRYQQQPIQYEQPPTLIRTETNDQRRNEDKDKDRDRDRDRDRRDRKRSSSRSNDRRRHDSGRDRRERERSISRDARQGRPWKSRNKSVVNFDVRPPDGVELPPIGVSTPVNGVPNSYYSYANNPAVTGIALPHVGGHSQSRGASTYQPQNIMSDKVDNSAASMVTRHARRIYAGGIPPRASEQEIMIFFNDIVTRALLPVRLPEPPVVKVYLNTEKVYAFVEFTSIELTTACLQLDGVKFDHYTGPTIIRVRRPSDYRPELLVGTQQGQTPYLNLESIGLQSTGVTVTNGPGKIFIGGLGYGLKDEQVMELLGVFGPIRAFHQVRDPSTSVSKGYGFCEYANASAAEAAIAGLNNMPFGEKVLSVRASTTTTAPVSMQPPAPMFNPMSMGIPNFSGYSNLPNVPQPIFMPPSNGLPPTRVLKLSNMVTQDDLYNEAEYGDIMEDVRLECIHHGGSVESIIIPRAKDGYLHAAEGYIFVEFSSEIGAQKAFNALNGRKFADKAVVVQYFDERKYANHDLI